MWLMWRSLFDGVMCDRWLRGWMMWRSLVDEVKGAIAILIWILRRSPFYGSEVAIVGLLREQAIALIDAGATRIGTSHGVAIAREKT